MTVATLARRARRWIRKRETYWRYVSNLGPTWSQMWARPQLAEEAERVLVDLNRDGVATTSVDALMPDDRVFDELLSASERLGESSAGRIAEARSSVDGRAGEKSFLVPYLEPPVVFDRQSVFARFCLDTAIAAIADAYFGMRSKLRYYDIWHVVASDAAPRESQLWHRDREDLFILKVFAYLSDVTEEAGPFTYAPGTTRKGRVRSEPECSVEDDGVRRTSDDQMDAVVPRDRWIKALGRRGTIVFADTAGFHKGGHATRRDRLTYTCMFTSPSSGSRDWFATAQTSTGVEP